MQPIEIRDVVKAFASRRALDGVTLELREGEVLGLLGPNGAGKSTLVRTIMGRVRPDSGSVAIFGVPAPAGDPASRARVGVVPQEIALYGNLNPVENLTVFGRYQGLGGKALHAAVARALEWASLADRSREPVRTFSGGMKRRLNMAAGVLHEPRVLLLDEPTVGVDPQSRERIYGMIEALREDRVAIVYTTHYMEEAERLCDRIAVIDHGRVVASGTKDELVLQTIGGRRSVVVVCEQALPEAATHDLTSLGATIEDRTVRYEAQRPEEMMAIVRTVEKHGVGVRELTMKSPTLETVFLHLTGRELRE